MHSIIMHGDPEANWVSQARHAGLWDHRAPMRHQVASMRDVAPTDPEGLPGWVEYDTQARGKALAAGEHTFTDAALFNGRTPDSHD